MSAAIFRNTENSYYKGDPEDQTLSLYERHFVIPQRVKELAYAEKCVVEAKALTSCRESSILREYCCVKFNRAFKKCMRGWYKNEQLLEKCTEEYLEERSQMRRIRQKLEE